MRARLAAAAVLAIFLALALRYAAGQQRVAQPGAAAPDFTLETLDGGTLALRELRGRPVLLNFWATWCPPCQEEAPALQAVHERYGDRLHVLGIDQKEGRVAVETFRRRFGLTYTLLLDPNGAVAERYGVRGLPESWLVDGDGVARLHHLGTLNFEDVQQLYLQATGRPIDGQGVGPVRAPGTAGDLAAAGGRLYAATGAGVVASPEGPDPAMPLADPAAWTPTGLNAAAHALAVAGQGGERLYAATDDGVWMHEAAAGPASGWRPVGLQGRAVHGLALSPDGTRGLAWVPGEGLFRLEAPPAGEHVWAPWPSNLDVRLERLALAADPAHPGRWLAGFDAGLLESADDGRHWRMIGGLERPVYGVAFSGSSLYLATDRGMWHSSDGGITASPQPSPARRYAGVSAGGAVTWALAPNGDLFHLTGEGWRRVTPAAR